MHFSQNYWFYPIFCVKISPCTKISIASLFFVPHDFPASHFEGGTSKRIYDKLLDIDHTYVWSIVSKWDAGKSCGTKNNGAKLILVWEK